jgi:hypothetical protein
VFKFGDYFHECWMRAVIIWSVSDLRRQNGQPAPTYGKSEFRQLDRLPGPSFNGPAHLIDSLKMAVLATFAPVKAGTDQTAPTE